MSMFTIPAFSVGNTELGRLETPLLVVPTSPARADALVGELKAVDAQLQGALGRAVARRDFRAARDETLLLAGGERGIQRVLLIGLGDSTDTVGALRRAATLAGRQANKMGVGSLAFYGAPDDTAAEAIVLGITAGAWDFREMKSPVPEAEQRASLAAAVILRGT